MKEKIDVGGIKDPAIPSFMEGEQRKQLRSRAIKNVQRRLESREELRRHLRGAHYIDRVHEAADRLYEEHDKLSTAAVGALKGSIDANLRLLDRILPVLKAVEVTDDRPGGGDPARLTTSELVKLILETKEKSSIPGEATEELPKLPWE